MYNCHILVGVPASGKSTLARKMGLTVFSTDDIITEIASGYGMTYNESFKDLIGFAEKIFWRGIDMGARQGIDMIIDRTNLSIKSRSKIIEAVRAHGDYRIHVHEFLVPHKTEWERRLTSRPGKTIPRDVLENMVRTQADNPVKMDEGIDTYTCYPAKSD